MRIWNVSTLMALTIGATLQVSTTSVAAKEPCRCLYPGGAVEEGKTACIERDGKQLLARCEKVLNNTSWHFLGSACDVTAARDRKTPPAS